MTSYPYYVVCTNDESKILAGWDYREDANDFIREFKEDLSLNLKVLTRAVWMRRNPGQSPRRVSSWREVLDLLA